MGTIDRIKKFMRLENMSNYALEKALGLSNGYIGKCKNPSSDVLENILLKYPRLSAEWLMRGEGDMYRDLKADAISSRLDEALVENDLAKKILEQMNIEELVRQEIDKQLNQKEA